MIAIWGFPGYTFYNLLPHITHLSVGEIETLGIAFCVGIFLSGVLGIFYLLWPVKNDLHESLEEILEQQTKILTLIRLEREKGQTPVQNVTHEATIQTSAVSLRAQFRLEPPIGIENIPEPERSRILAEIVPKSGFIRSQQMYMKATNGDLTNCEVKLIVDGNGVDHMLWEGIRRQPPANAKEKVTIHRDDEKYFTLWYAHQKDGKEYLYMPTTDVRHMARQIGAAAPPLIVDVQILADGFVGKRHRFIIYRESWEGILAKEIDENGVTFAEFDSNWHRTDYLRPSVISFAPQGSDTASTLHIGHRGKGISLTGRMSKLTPACPYQVEIESSYNIGDSSEGRSEGNPQTSFTTNQSGEANWFVTISADELAAHGFKRFSVWIVDKQRNLKVLVSDNLAFHN